MKFQIHLDEEKVTVSLEGKPILILHEIMLNLPRHESHAYKAEKMIEEENGISVVYRGGTMILHFCENAKTLCVSYDIDLNRNTNSFFELLGVKAENGIVFHMEYMPGFEEYVADSASECYYWLTPEFGHNQDTIPYNTECLLMRRGKQYAAVLALPGNPMRTEICREGLALSSGSELTCRCKGTPLVLSISDAPYDAIRESYLFGEKNRLFPAPLRTQRSYPDVFNGFGWCTWDAFYHDVTADGIYQKLDEFREKGIPLRWLLIDDGWSDCTENFALCSFQENQEKFPEGLAACIRKIKEEYGVKYVGVWHAFTAHWMGVKEDSELFRQQKDNLVCTPYGQYYPSWEYEKALSFWDSWHCYLAAQGVDFVKVDNQGGYAKMIQTMAPSAGILIGAQKALEDSVKKNFHNLMINCMGMDMENVLRRDFSPLCRNSDDFFPQKEDGFYYHVTQNAFNAIFAGEIHHCDFDMWWSQHESALPSAVLRAISGGPVYVSDKIGATDSTYIRPLVNGDEILRCDSGPARPTADCLFRGSKTSRAPLKLYNKAGNNYAVAAFGFQSHSPCTLTMADIPGMNGEYLAYDFFAGSYFLFDDKTEISFELQNLSCALFHFYPIHHGHALIGNPEKYMGCADSVTRDVSVAEMTEIQ